LPGVVARLKEGEESWAERTAKMKSPPTMAGARKGKEKSLFIQYNRLDFLYYTGDLIGNSVDN
jgi:hypothetical protein